MRVQNNNSNISARPDLVTNLLLILILTSFTLQLCFLRKIFGYSPKSKIENSLYNFLPVQYGGFWETACPKDRQDRSCLNPCGVRGNDVQS